MSYNYDENSVVDKFSSIAIHSNDSDSGGTKLYVPPHLRNRGAPNGVTDSANDSGYLNRPPRGTSDSFRGRPFRGSYSNRGAKVGGEWQQSDSRWSTFNGNTQSGEVIPLLAQMSLDALGTHLLKTGPSSCHEMNEQSRSFSRKPRFQRQCINYLLIY
uniref:SJCHGC08759 protein n=1 Tax=Schistosoma japonicum TaxID=6182 RepID=Q5D8H7_SCHJA|nr:SJCHGC08759 protein [Schistosoma japonicum]